ncbi:MAG: hypothetical protein HZB38_14675 [Planctomycetes bacterium]|nr:hypothetical protein [Planctomycetota bacterium]
MSTRLESGPARADTLWQLGLMLLSVGLGLYFFYDWKIGYPEKNCAEAAKTLKQQMSQLSPPMSVPDPLPTRPRKPEFEALLAATGRSPESVSGFLGAPLFERTEGGVVTRYYASEFGMVTAPYKNGLAEISAGSWRDWYKNEGEVEAQRYFGIFCVAVGFYFLIRTFRAMTLKVTLDDQAMVYAGRTIPTATMTKLTDYSAKGWVDLYYDSPAGPKKLRLDNQKVARFDEIIVELCRIKGFTDPRPKNSPDA